jgi:hypothetical protein
LSVLLPSKRDLAVRRGPTIGHAPSVVVALHQGKQALPEEVFAELVSQLEALQSTEQVLPRAPRRGKRLSRERVLCTVRFAHGIRHQAALKAVRRVVFTFFKQLAGRPTRRLERRQKRHLYNQALRTENLKRSLAPAR